MYRATLTPQLGFCISFFSWQSQQELCQAVLCHLTSLEIFRGTSLKLCYLHIAGRTEQLVHLRIDRKIGVGEKKKIPSITTAPSQGGEKEIKQHTR